MKITAHFDSPDSADFAAGALKRTLSPLTVIETKDIPTKSGKVNMNIFSSFNLVGMTPTYSMPVYNLNAYDDKTSQRKTDYLKTDNILEVVCRKEDEAAAMRIIVGYGGRNIDKI